MFGCRKKMSAIAVLDYSSAEGMHKRMTLLAAAGREDWQQHRAKGLEPPPPADDDLNLVCSSLLNLHRLDTPADGNVHLACTLLIGFALLHSHGCHRSHAADGDLNLLSTSASSLY